MLVIEFTSLDGHLQIILPGRQGASGESCEGARRVFRLVEIENYLSIFRQTSVEESPGGISLFAAGGIFEDKKQVIAFEHWLEAAPLAVHFKRSVARARILLRVAEDIENRNKLGLRI